MNRTPSNAALVILLAGAAIVTPAVAQDAGKPVPGANLQYVGADTRVGIGIDSDNRVRGELSQVLRSDDKAATLAELWASRNAGGAKLSQHWTSGKDAVNKVFAAYDQGDSDRRKATVGGGQEYERWFWNTYLSRGLSGARLDSVSAVASTITQTGSDSGRPYEQDLTTTVTTRNYSRAYDWGVGARIGHFYESALVRVTAGLDYEWGKFSSKQWTGTLLAEKFFAGSPVSIALSGEFLRKSGDFEGSRHDQRGLLMLRYEFGAPKSSFRPNRVTRTVTTTERVADPSWKPPVAAQSGATAATAGTAGTASTGAAPSSTGKLAEAATRLEKRVTRANSNDAQETYFDLGSAKLKPAAMKELDALVARIAAQRPYVELKVNVVGHTCPTGSDRNNFALSKKRAEAVKAYLVSKGVAENLISTDGKAGRSPKYPEVKGQSFRNRRADTEVLIVKEKVEEVRVPVAAAAPAPAPAPATPAGPSAAVPAATAPMIERQVQREVVEEVPNNWIARALHNTAQHKSAVDTYRYAELSTAQSTGARRYLNRGPAAVNDAYTIECGAASTFNVLVNDSDPDGDALTITSVSAPGKGTAVVSGGKIVYTPNAASCAGGTDTFTYTISDGKGGTSTATVTVTILRNNNPPAAVNDAYTIDCGAASTFPVLVNDSDPDGDALTLTGVSAPGKGTASIAAGKIVYTPNAASCAGATDTFTYTISDGKGGTATATVNVTIRSNNRPPVAVDDRYIVPCGGTRVLDVLVNDADPDGDPLSIASITQPRWSTISVSADGKTLNYTGGPACFNTDTFTYTVRDGKGGTATATVTLIDP